MGKFDQNAGEEVPSYTVATAPAPSATVSIKTHIAFFSDGAAGNPVIAYWSGTAWLRCDTRAAIASS